LALASLVLVSGQCAWPPGNATVPPVIPGVEPTEAAVASWNASTAQGKVDEVLTAADQVIAAGPETPGYADAHLYRGAARFLQGQFDLALTDLMVAEQLQDQFVPKYRQQERLLLYRGLMVASASLGQAEQADRYLEQAISLAPDLEQALRQELKTRTLVIDEFQE
jgi:tetratricopeptide (TPR) repeat protein